MDDGRSVERGSWRAFANQKPKDTSISDLPATGQPEECDVAYEFVLPTDHSGWFYIPSGTGKEGVAIQAQEYGFLLTLSGQNLPPEVTTWKMRLVGSGEWSLEGPIRDE